MTKSSTLSTEHLQNLANLTQTKVFLGKEFLTWLWYMSDEKVHVDVELVDSDEVIDVELWIDDRILLESDNGSKEESLMRHGDPSKSSEAAVALENGKTVKELKLGIRIREYGEFTSNLSYDQLNPKSLQLPISQNQNDDEEIDSSSKLSTRIHQTNVFLSVLNGLFLMFLNERTDKNWEDKGLRKIREWITAKAKQSKRGTLH